MSLNKAIEHGKEHRRQYRSWAKLCDKSCRNHGGCPWCMGNRMINTRRGKSALEDDLKEFYQEQ